MLTFAPLPLLSGILFLVLWLFIARRRGKSPGYIFFSSIFGIYLLALVRVTIFPIPPNDWNGFSNFQEFIAQIQKVHALNLIPVYFGSCWELPRPCRLGIYQNILMTMPFGFGISFITRIRVRKISWLAAGVGLAIETSQFLLDLAIGSAYRTVDVNDALFNTIGVLLGYNIFRLCAFLYISMVERLGTGYGWLSSYIYEIVLREQITRV